MSKQDWKQNSLDQLFQLKGLWHLPKDITILDLACGLSLRSKYIPASIRVGVDIYDEYFKHIEADVPYVVIRQDIRDLSIFPDKSFDLVIALDVVEHLTKNESLAMIKECERIARKAVIIETPEGFIPQNIDILGHGGDEYQTHRSGWEATEFEDMGYSVILRPYQMQDVKRHTDLEVDTNITLIDAIKYV